MATSDHGPFSPRVLAPLFMFSGHQSGDPRLPTPNARQEEFYWRTVALICNCSTLAQTMCEGVPSPVNDQSEQSNAIVARVCELPAQFRARGDVSMVQLVLESGLIESPEALTPRAVSDYLRQHEHLVEAWTMLSEDKRTSSGWYFVERSDVSFEVGYYPDGPRISFSDRVQACAEFIVREANAIAACS